MLIALQTSECLIDIHPIIIPIGLGVDMCSQIGGLTYFFTNYKIGLDDRAVYPKDQLLRLAIEVQETRIPQAANVKVCTLSEQWPA